MIRQVPGSGLVGFVYYALEPAFLGAAVDWLLLLAWFCFVLFWFSLLFVFFGLWFLSLGLSLGFVFVSGGRSLCIRLGGISYHSHPDFLCSEKDPQLSTPCLTVNQLSDNSSPHIVCKGACQGEWIPRFYPYILVCDPTQDLVPVGGNSE